MNRYKKIVLAGGTGQIGTALTKYFADKADEIIILSRSKEGANGRVKYFKWDGKNLGDWSRALEGTDILVNLAGKNVNCRYNEKNKKEIFDSRSNSVEVLAKAYSLCSSPPSTWIQCASATIYRHAEDRPMTEENGEIGEGFSVEVCKRWEKSFWEQTEQWPQMQKAILRTSLVFGKDEGVFPRLKNITRFGLGGKQGNGKQWVSWIHETDVARIVEWIAGHREIQGAINCTAPYPVQNSTMMSIMRKTLGMPLGLPSPKLLLELGAFIIGTETELLLKSRWVLPDKLLKSGFEFQFPELDVAIRDISKQ